MKVNGVPVVLVIRENKSMMLKNRPTKAYINLKALINNYRTLQQHAGAGMSVLPVIKANAYGHGAMEVAAALQQIGVDLFAVATVAEALAVKKSGIKGRYLILGSIYQDDLQHLHDGDVVPVVWQPEIVRILGEYAVSQGIKIPVQVKVDTGMHRAGVPLAAAPGTSVTSSMVQSMHTRPIIGTRRPPTSMNPVLESLRCNPSA